MANKIIKKDQLTGLLNKIAADYQLIAPVQEDNDIYLFKPVASADNVAVEYSNSVVPPKDFFFPQSEKMFTYDLEGGNVAITEEPSIKSRVLFGARPCDIRSVLYMDKVFDSQFKDSYYLDKRANTIIIGLSCNDVQSTCFCTTFGISPTESNGSDILLTDLGDVYLAEVLTDKGEAIVTKYSSFFTDENGQADKKTEKTAALVNMMKRSTNVDGLAEKLAGMFEHPIWADLCKKCLGCGACTYVCPTCHCFDIYDHKQCGYVGERFRCWDSCMFSEYTRMAGGHNPRETKKERVRNRMLHKLQYSKERYDMDGCVGCGRCVAKCPVNLDITQSIAQLKEVEA